jgi:hypothetical protein
MHQACRPDPERRARLESFMFGLSVVFVIIVYLGKA